MSEDFPLTMDVEHIDYHGCTTHPDTPPTFAGACSLCGRTLPVDYHGTIDGRLATITRYPDGSITLDIAAP